MVGDGEMDEDGGVGCKRRKENKGDGREPLSLSLKVSGVMKRLSATQ